MANQQESPPLLPPGVDLGGKQVESGGGGDGVVEQAAISFNDNSVERPNVIEVE